MLTKTLLSLLLVGASLSATEATRDNVAKLYVATFDRAPDAAGLEYWVNTSGLSLEGIATSFFDQDETKLLYPTNTANNAFVESVYQNLFNRSADALGLDYWVGQLDSGAVSTSVFIQAVIDGAKDDANGNDASTLTNKAKVGLTFANYGYDDVDDAKAIMENISDDDATINTAYSSYNIATKSMVLTGNITADMTLTADTLWILDGLVVVKDGATLTIEPGTTIAAYDGTGANSSYMIIDKGSKIIADGTKAKPIVFTSTKVVLDGEEAAVGQWGGLTIIGHAGNSQVNPYEVNPAFTADATNMADSSGIIRNVKILNSGITMEQDKEINGLSFVGVGSGTIVEDITIDNSDDDCIELWGGTVNLTNVALTNCTDDYFDIDDGFSGTVKNLNIVATLGNSAIEMSGTTSATFDGFTIVQNGSGKEGTIYFKKDAIGGHFLNGTITDNVDDTYGAIYSKSANKTDDTVDQANISFENVTINGSSTGARFTGTSAVTLEGFFNAGTGNTVATAATAPAIPSKKVDLTGNITADMTLTADTLWILDGLVVVKDGATLTIEPGTTIAAYDGTGANSSYMIIDKGSKIIADGTKAKPIVFTSTKVVLDGEEAAVGQWGGLTIIGHAGNSQVNPYEVNPAFTADATNMADSSGIIRNVKILNSGITMEQDKEINGLSFVGVGSGTIVEDITIDNSDDDCIELWGGTVNLTNVALTNCTDDYFDIDDGFSGTVKNLNIVATLGNSAIEMSGTTSATFDGFTIVQNGSGKEGTIYFKKDAIGGHFLNGTITDNVDDTYGAIYSKSANKTDDTVDQANISFENVTINGSSTGARFTGTSAVNLETKFNSGTNNTKN